MNRIIKYCTTGTYPITVLIDLDKEIGIEWTVEDTNKPRKVPTTYLTVFKRYYLENKLRNWKKLEPTEEDLALLVFYEIL